MTRAAVFTERAGKGAPVLLAPGLEVAGIIQMMQTGR